MLKFLKETLKPYQKWVTGVLILQVGQVLLSLYLPTINAGIIDYGVANADKQYILARGGLMIVLSFLQFGFAICASVCGAKAALASGRDMRERVYVQIMSFSQQETARYGAPTLITRATNDVQQVVQFMTLLFTVVVNAPIMFIGGIALAFSQDIALSMVIVAALVVLAGISVVFVMKLVPCYRVQQERVDEMNGVLRDQITGVRVAKAFVKETYEQEKLDKVNEKLFHLSVRIGRMVTVLPAIFMFLVNGATICLLWFGGVRAEAGEAQIGQIIAFITYLSFILSATLAASMIFIMLPRAEVSMERIREVLNTESSVREAASAVSLDGSPQKKILEFEKVGFSYAPENPEVDYVLKNISFCAKPGTTTAIIGSTGCGKTTLLNLAVRLADVTEGVIRMNQTDIREIKRTDLEKVIGLVPQKAFLFSGTLEKNLRYGKEDATEEELWEALRIAQAEEFIRDQEDGLQMRVSEGGANFSGGQRQRLAIARAIVRRPQIYIFDDSFSALDYTTDRNLRSALKGITEDAVVIIVAQRITSVVDADQILVMNHGGIEDAGTHTELLSRCHTYQEIAKSQPSDEHEREVPA